MAVLAKVLFEFTHFFEILGGEGGGGLLSGSLWYSVKSWFLVSCMALKPCSFPGFSRNELAFKPSSLLFRWGKSI